MFATLTWSAVVDSVLQVSGLTGQAQLLLWLKGGNRTSVVSSCVGVNCQDTCPPVLTGENSFCSDKS